LVGIRRLDMLRMLVFQGHSRLESHC